MAEYSNPLTQKVFEILKPLMGSFMAQGAMKSQFNKLNINQDSLTRNDLARLADELGKGLNSFLGSNVTQQVVTKIKSIT